MKIAFNLIVFEWGKGTMPDQHDLLFKLILF